MTQILIDIRLNGDDSQLLTGKLRVTRQAIGSNGSRLYLPDPVEYTLSGSNITIDLRASEQDKVAYHFEILQLDPDNTYSPLYDFYAVVPDSLTPINLSDLAKQSGLRYDQQDGSLLSLARYLLGNDTFINYLLGRILNPRGIYNNSATYKRGDAVLFNGDGYICISPTPTTGNQPPDPVFWILYAKAGANGATLGGTDPYGVSWVTGTDAPARSILYPILEGLQTKAAMTAYAPISGAVLDNTQLSSNPLITDDSARIPSTSWVVARMGAVGSVPVGARLKWDNAALPPRYLAADGSMVSKVTYPLLATVFGTQYGADTPTTFKLPLAAGEIIYTG